MPFEFRKLDIPDVIEITPLVFEDVRGFFAETYKFTDFSKFGINKHFIQDNHSKSQKGTLRGLHYQKNPTAQAKLVRCIKGKIFDVAVDIRKDSPFYAKWVGAVLSEKNKKMLYIPEGFAHGFAVLSSCAEVVYKASEVYSPENDSGIRWDDPEININWRLADPIISNKDRNLPLLADAEINFIYSD